MLVFQAQHDQCGQTLGIDRDVTDIATFSGEFSLEKLAVLLIADACQHGGFQAKPGASKRDIGGGTAQVFGKAGDIGQRCTDLLRIQINREAADADDVERTIRGKIRGKR